MAQHLEDRDAELVARCTACDGSDVLEDGQRLWCRKCGCEIDCLEISIGGIL